MNLTNLIIVSVIATGISSISVQLITVREFLSQFYGNEITISLVLFCWLMVSGLGSLASKFLKKRSITLYSILALITGLFPLIQIIAIRLFRDTVFIHGESPGFYPLFLFILTLSAPYAFLIGFILPYSLGVIKANRKEFTVGKLYITDNIGDIAGGVLFSFILVYFFSPFKIIALTSFLLILLSLALIIRLRRYLLFLGGFLSIILFFAFALEKRFELFTLSHQYGVNIVSYRESPYGRIVLTEEKGQYTFWESGTPIFSTFNIISAEEKVHYPLCQLDRVEDVLLVSGGMGETFDEILKYSPHRIDYVELDPTLIKVASQSGLLSPHEQVSIIPTDGRRYIAESDKRYSAIILDLSEPDTFQMNRFYTKEFFDKVKGILRKDGILSFSLIANPNYLSEVRLKKLSSIFNTVKKYFDNVLLIPGEEIYFLASDGKLATDIPRKLRRRSIATSYIDGFYYGNVTEERIRSINESMNPNEPMNTDFQPRVINIMFAEWFKKYGTSPHWFIATLIGTLVFYLFLIKKEEYVLFSTGFAAMGVEMLILFCFQVIYGYVYLKVGAIISCFLLGLLPGAVLGDKWKKRGKRMLIKAETGMLLLLMIYLIWVTFSQSTIPEYVFFLFGFTFSLLCGLQFPVAAEIIGEEKSPAAGLFAADLVGAGAGTLAVGTLLIPLLGIQAAIISLFLIKAASTIVILKG
ncbi:MAG: fused MFS/spermidine synthase [Desulfatiglandales bacterium]